MAAVVASAVAFHAKQKTLRVRLGAAAAWSSGTSVGLAPLLDVSGLGRSGLFRGVGVIGPTFLDVGSEARGARLTDVTAFAFGGRRWERGPMPWDCRLTQGRAGRRPKVDRRWATGLVLRCVGRSC